MRADKRRWFTQAVLTTLTLSCAGTDEIQPEDVTAVDRSEALADDGAGAPFDEPGDALPPPPPMGPPEAVFTACEGLDADASCSFTIDGHSVDGTCRPGPNGEPTLGCMPADLPPPPARGRRRGPPPFPPMPPREALQACQGQAADAPCQFTIRDRTIDGACWAPPQMQGAPLACAPPEVRAHVPPAARAR